MLDLSLVDLALAMAPPPQEGGQQGGGSFLSILPPILMMFLIFYFILIRPQQKKQSQTRKMLDNLKEGDNVITLSGIHGIIRKLKEDVVTLQIADNVRIKINRSSIGMIKNGGTGQEKDKDPEKEKEDKGSSKNKDKNK